MKNLYHLILYQPILKLLAFFYEILGNFGLAIIFLTLFIRGLLIPLTLPAIKSAQKMKELSPELEKLKKKYKKDKQKLQQEQLKLYRKHGVNPAMGCFPYLIQFAVLIALYNSFRFFIGGEGKVNGTIIQTNFLWLDLTKPDPYYVLPILAGLSQLLMSKAIAGQMQPDSTEKKKKKKKKKSKESKDDMASAMADMQKQMIYLMPLMTVFIGAKLPSGLALYWLITSLFSAGQQYFLRGGWEKLKKRINKK